MVKITIKGKQYVLRYDMSVAEWLEEKYGDARQAFTQMNDSKQSATAITDIFCAMANAANDYLGVNESVSDKDLQLFSKHTSPGRVKLIMRAIIEALADGNRMQTSDDEDNEIHDEYLKEINKEEKAKN